MENGRGGPCVSTGMSTITRISILAAPLVFAVACTTTADPAGIGDARTGGARLPSSSSPGSSPGSPGSSSTVRTDREPITKRFSALGAFESVHWLGGAHGSPQSRTDLPGPTDYWIEAVVRLRPEDFAALRDRFGGNRNRTPVAAPTARPALRSALPSTGEWVTVPGLTEEVLATSGMSGEVRLHPATRTVYVSAGTR